MAKDLFIGPANDLGRRESEQALHGRVDVRILQGAILKKDAIVCGLEDGPKPFLSLPQSFLGKHAISDLKEKALVCAFQLGRALVHPQFKLFVHSSQSVLRSLSLGDIS